MFKKIILVAAAAILSTSLYAQKPVVTAVSGIEDDPANGLEMSRSLFIEYFLSELSTKAKVNVIGTAVTQNAVTKLKFKHGEKLSKAEISKLCSELKVGAICFVTMKRESGGPVKITINIKNDKGDEIGSVSSVMKTIGDAGEVSRTLSRDAAVAIRKLNGAVLIGEAIDSVLKNNVTSAPLPTSVQKID